MVLLSKSNSEHSASFGGRKTYLRKEQRTLNVHIENTIKLLFRNLLQFIERHDSGTSDQDIEFSEVADGGVD